jgi:glutathione S-transferase
MIKIHNFPRGARGLRVAWQCEEMGLAYRMEAVTYPPGAAYLALNALGTVPFLEDDGVAINESIAMMLYLAERYGPTPLLPGRDNPAHARVLQMLVFGETTMGTAMNPLIEAKFAAPEADKRNWTVNAQEARLQKAVRFAEDILGGNAFFAGNDFTLADISVGCGLGMWRGALGKTLSDRMASYRDRLAERPAYQRALKTQQPG